MRNWPVPGARCNDPMLDSCSIGRLEGDDELDQVVALEQASFTSPWSRDMLERELRNADVARVYVVRNAQGRVVAFCACWFIFEELHINTLAVDAGVRRRGLATALLRHIVAEALEAGARRATLEVRQSNTAALRLYEGLGFSVQAVRPKYYADPVEDGLVLWNDHLSPLPADA